MDLRAPLVAGATGAAVSLALLSAIPWVAGALAGRACDSLPCAVLALLFYGAMLLVIAPPVAFLLAWSVLVVVRVRRAFLVAAAGTATAVTGIYLGYSALPEGDDGTAAIVVVSGVVFAAWAVLLSGRSPAPGRTRPDSSDHERAAR